MFLEDPYVAYCFDQAVGELGSFIKHELESIQGKTQSAVDGKRLLRLKALLSDDPKQQFAQPVVTAQATAQPKDGESNA